MLPISPTELAQLLQLSSGPDGTASIPAEDCMKEALGRLASFTFEKGASEQAQGSYTEEFCSQYLPSFLRNMLAGGDTQGAYFLRILEAMCASSRTPLDRFIRDSPQEACKVYLWEAHVLVLRAEQNDTLLVNEDGINALIQDTIRLLTVASVCKDDPRILTSEAWGPEKRHCRTAIKILTGLASASDMKMRKQQSVWLRTTDSSVHHWWACELEGTSTASSDCVRMEDGAEMMACSRCIAVRYCSREHQKADWKRHKLVCFKPSW